MLTCASVAARKARSASSLLFNSKTQVLPAATVRATEVHLLIVVEIGLAYADGGLVDHLDDFVQVKLRELLF